MTRPPPFSSSELEALLEAAEAPLEEPLPTYADPFRVAFQAWVEAFGVKPGSAPAAISADLYRHFLAWCVENGTAVAPPHQNAWGAALKSLGLAQGRLREHNRDWRPYLMARNPAGYFRKWLEENPTPPKGQISFHYPSKGRPPRVGNGVESDPLDGESEP